MDINKDLNNIKIIEKIHINLITNKSDKRTDFKINGERISIDHEQLTWEWENFNNFDHKRVFNLSITENHSVLMLIIELLKKGYKKNEIYLEKKWQLGHKNKGYLDIAIYKGGKPFYFIEVKEFSELINYVSMDSPNKTKQLFSYVWQEQSVKIGSYVSFDFEKKNFSFYNTIIDKKILDKSSSLDEYFDRWDRIWDKKPYILSQDRKFDIEIPSISYNDLQEIGESDVKMVFNQFLTILRQYSVSDKSNAFDKMINLFVAKISDELSEGGKFEIDGQKFSGVQFQFVEGKDNKLSLLKRLNDLYKDGMSNYLGKDIIDYNEAELVKIMGENNEKVLELFEDLRLKKDNAFSFIEVYDEETFENNFYIVKEIVKLLENYRFKYNNKFQYLGDFFEELLSTSWKQEAGQFFTPMPIVNMIVDSLPAKEVIHKNIDNNSKNIIPLAIDYACGSGHFLVSYMDKIQNLIEEMDVENFTNKNKDIVNSFKVNPFSWAKNSVYGIEKDYRLSKTTKVASFLNGDGEANILNGNGLAKFNSDLFAQSDIFSNQNENRIFDFVIANPPYSVKGFLKSLINDGIEDSDFELLKNYNMNSSEIEVLFVERTAQLLKEKGVASIILPRSVLTADKYIEMRKYIFKKFEVKVIFELGDLTFGGTTTSPVILYLVRKDVPSNDYKVLIINSPKTLFENGEEEKKFLGYKFSTNKNKLGIEYINDNLTQLYSPIINQFILGDENQTQTKYITVKKISKIVFGNEKEIYPKYKKLPPSTHFTIKEYATLVTSKTPITNEEEKYKYIEIGSISEGGKITPSKKIMEKEKVIAKKGDLLISSIANVPGKWKFAIADDNYRVTKAIYVFRFKDKNIRDIVYKSLINNENSVIQNMQSLADGFKITYSKISANNMMNRIQFKKL